MRLVSYAAAAGDGEVWRAGVLLGERIVDAQRLAAERWPALPGERFAAVRRLLTLPAEVAAELEAAAEEAPDACAVALADAVLGPPVPDPDKILCLGLNYSEHADESRMEVPPAPTLFAKFRNSLIGDGAAIPLPEATTMVDYEGELAVVIGRACKHVGADEAPSVVAGYMVLNDVSARDLQRQTGQWTAGKAIDGFAPCGPALVTADEVGDPQALRLETRLNGRVMQQADTSRMVFGVRETITFVTKLITLEPGDIIATGTPAGVGAARTPPVFLAPDDEIEVEISGLGLLRNTVVAERAPARASAHAPSDSRSNEQRNIDGNL